MEPAHSHAKINQGRGKRIRWEGKKNQYAFPHPGGLYVVAKPFGDDHRVRASVSCHL
jgi:hypothetical protein